MYSVNCILNFKGRAKMEFQLQTLRKATK